MNWSAIIAGLLGLLDKVLGVFKARELKQAGINTQVQAQQTQVIDTIAKVKDAQNNFNREYAARPDGVSDAGYTDEFCRDCDVGPKRPEGGAGQG